MLSACLSTRIRLLVLALIPLLPLLVPQLALAETRVIVLGTGNPTPNPERSGPGVAILTNGKAYLFDAGGGMVHKATQASFRYDLPELLPQNVDYLFITHLHSDHIHDINELASARWWARQERLQLFGPKGIADYAENMHNMAAIEADIRAVGTPPELVTDRHGYLTDTTEIEDGLVFENDDIRVEAFTVPHGEIKPSFGYKVTTADKTIVLSGDTSYSETLLEQARGADILIHEVISGDNLADMNEFWQAYHGASHTSTSELAALASEAQPKLLVLYHIIFLEASAAQIIEEVERGYKGQVVLADDLDIF